MHIVHFKNMLASKVALPSMKLSQAHIYHVSAAMKSFIYLFHDNFAQKRLILHSSKLNRIL